MFKLKLKNKKISLEDLKTYLHYDPKTGFWTWKISTGRRAKVGSKITAKEGKEGYIRVKVKRKKYRAHRLAWFYMTGKWPKNQIDHKDKDVSNNKWENLREATNSQNQHNKGKYKSNTTGYKGVSFDKRDKVYKAGIRVNGKRIHLGSFSDPEEAYKIYCKAAVKYHNEFRRFA